MFTRGVHSQCPIALHRPRRQLAAAIRHAAQAEPRNIHSRVAESRVLHSRSHPRPTPVGVAHREFETRRLKKFELSNYVENPANSLTCQARTGPRLVHGLFTRAARPMLH